MQQYTFWIVTTIIGGMIGILAFFIKRLINDLEKKIAESETSSEKRFAALEKRVEKQDERFDKLVHDLPTKYAYRDDLIRMTQNIEGKLDKIQELLMDKGVKGG